MGDCCAAREKGLLPSCAISLSLLQFHDLLVYPPMAGPLCWGATCCMSAWAMLHECLGDDAWVPGPSCSTWKAAAPHIQFCACRLWINRQPHHVSLFLCCFCGIVQAEGLSWSAGLDLHGCSGKLCRLVCILELGICFYFLFTELDWSGVWRAI